MQYCHTGVSFWELSLVAMSCPVGVEGKVLSVGLLQRMVSLSQWFVVLCFRNVLAFVAHITNKSR